MEEINYIWNQANDPHWNATRLEVAAIYGGVLDENYLQFVHRAADASVNH